MHIAITGCSGLIGSALTEYLFSQNHVVHCLPRNGDDASLLWDNEKIEEICEKHGDFDAVVHLAAENIAAGRWFPGKKKRIMRSRVQGSHEIASYFSNLTRPPKVMIFASAIGYYGDRGNERLDEDSSLGDTFLAEVCSKWEAAADPAVEAGIRVVHTRFGMVLSPHGGALQKMMPAFKAGLGGRIGSGQQYMSWISIADVVAAIDHLIVNKDLSGPFNLTSANPATNQEFTQILAQTVGKPAVLPVPAMMIKLIFGQMGKELLLGSSRVFPKKLLDAGYIFRHNQLQDALAYCHTSSNRL